MNEAGFLFPIGLLGLIVIAAIGKLVFSIEVSIAELHRSLGWSGSPGRLRIAAPLALFTLGVIAVSRPYLGKETLRVEGRGREIFLAVDVSASMRTPDVSPTRIEFAKRKAHDIVEFIKRNTPDSRVGVILFAGDAYVYCPLTPDALVVQEYIRAIEPGLITTKGSSLWRAFDTVKQAIQDAKAADPQLIVISDGEDLSPETEMLAQQIDSWPSPILFLGVGTPDGQPIPFPEGGFVSANGEIVISKLNEALLQRLFHSSTHAYRRATVLDTDFADFLSAPPTAIVRRGDSMSHEIASYGELGPGILGMALLGLTILSILGKLPRALFALALFLPPAARADDNPLNDSIAHEAYLHYQENDFQGAFDRFAEALKTDPHNPKILQGLGSAAFKLGKYPEAENAFRAMEGAAKASKHRFDASYNRALAIFSNDVPALNNRSIAEAYLQQEEEEKKKQEQQKEQNQDQQQNDQNDEQKENSEQQQNSDERAQKNTEHPEEKDSSTEDSREDQRESAKEEQKNGEPSEQAQQTPTPSENMSTEKNSENAEASPTPQSSTAAGQRDESAQPSAVDSPLPTPQSDAGEQASQSAKSQAIGDTNQKIDQTPLTERQAAEWLKGLPESPILIQRLNRKTSTNTGGQTW